MKNLILLILALTSGQIIANENTWSPTLDLKKAKDLIDSERKLEVYKHSIKNCLLYTSDAADE